MSSTNSRFKLRGLIPLLTIQLSVPYPNLNPIDHPQLAEILGVLILADRGDLEASLMGLSADATRRAGAHRVFCKRSKEARYETQPHSTKNRCARRGGVVR